MSDTNTASASRASLGRRDARDHFDFPEADLAELRRPIR